MRINIDVDIDEEQTTIPLVGSQGQSQGPSGGSDLTHCPLGDVAVLSNV